MKEGEEDTPWTEEQWEEFMRVGDLRAARYGELMETLSDHPERDDIIDKEMGWDRKRDKADREWLAELQEAMENDEDEDAFADDDEEGVTAEQDISKCASQSEQLDQMRRRRRDELDDIPAYTLCEEASGLIDRVVEPLMNKSGNEEGGDHDLAEAFIQMKIACAKIAGGHGMGYEDEVLGGNVVNCKKSLAATHECTAAINELVKRRLITKKQADPLLAAVQKARVAVEQRIAELRSRMWWQRK